MTYKIAKFYHDKSQKTNHETRFYKARAFQICQTAIERFAKSEGAKNCQNLQKKIKQKSFSFEFEKVNLPNTTVLATLKYQNVKKLYAKIVKLDEGDYKKIKGVYAAQSKDRRTMAQLTVSFFNQKESLESWDLALPAVQDFHQYTAHIAIPKLQIGSYIVLLSTSDDFSTLKNATAYSEIQLTDISYVIRDMPKSKQFLLLSRSTGKPLAGVNVEVTETNYNGSKKTNRATYTSDKNGYFSIPRKQGSYNHIKFAYKKDVFEPNLRTA